MYCVLPLISIHVLEHLINISEDPQMSAWTHLPLFLVGVSSLNIFKDMGQ